MVTDVPLEASLGTQGAAVFTTLSSNIAKRTPAQFLADWEDLTNINGPMICTRAKFFAQFKTFQETECSNQSCSYMSAMQSTQFLQFMSNQAAVQAMQSKLIPVKK